jgi:hypothetical protein
MPPKKKAKAAPSLAGEVCAFSGFRDEKLVDLIIAAGGIVAGSMTKSVTMVVCKSTSNTTAEPPPAVASERTGRKSNTSLRLYFLPELVEVYVGIIE